MPSSTRHGNEAGHAYFKIVQWLTGGVDPDATSPYWDTTSTGVRQYLKDGAASAYEFFEGANSYLKFVTTNSAEQVVFGKPIAFASSAQLIADPGTGAAIPVNRGNISISITQNGAETNTLAIPSYVGQRLSLVVDVDTSGARVVTSAQAINQAGNTVITMTDVNDFIELVGVQCAGGALRWRVVVNDGCVLS